MLPPIELTTLTLFNGHVNLFATFTVGYPFGNNIDPNVTDTDCAVLTSLFEPDCV